MATIMGEKSHLFQHQGREDQELRHFHQKGPISQQALVE